MINKGRTFKRIEKRGSDGKKYFAERHETIDKDRTVTLTERYVIDGREYRSLADMSQREREHIERMLAEQDGVQDVFRSWPLKRGTRVASDEGITASHLLNGWFSGGSIPISTSARIKPWQVMLAVYLVVVLTSLGLCLMTTHDQFLPSVAYTRRVETAGIVIALVLSSPLLVIVFHSATGWRERCAAPFLAIVLFYVVRVAMSSGVPAVLHRFSDAPAELVVTVTEPGDGYLRRCGYHADVHHPMIVSDTVCDLGDWVWMGLAPGDQLKLSGSLSEFGFGYDPDLAKRIPAPALEK